MVEPTGADLLAGAIALATRCHAGQLRKGSERPYLEHPRGVALLLDHFYPQRAELIAAGWLHDVLEESPLKLSPDPPMS